LEERSGNKSTNQINFSACFLLTKNSN